MSYHSTLVRIIVNLCFICLLAGGQTVAADDMLFTELQEQARAGDVSAQYQLAELYYRGDGVPRNHDVALSWYEKAADQGHIEAQYQMGYFYKHGLSNLAKDDKKSFEWFHKAAMQGHTPSQTKVAIMYSQGIGVEENQALSRQWADGVLKKKGYIGTSNEGSVKTGKVKPETPVGTGGGSGVNVDTKTPEKAKQPQVSVDRGVAEKDKQAATASPTPQSKPAVTRTELTAEQKKAWRYEQARRLVEEANKKAAIGWSDED